MTVVVSGPKGMVAVLAFLILASACVTPKEKKEIQNDIFNVQTRLLSLEHTLTDTTKEARNTGDSAAKRVASAQADMDRFSRDIQQIRGDIDALRVGVTTGRMPGAVAGEPSLAESLEQIGERLESVEASQEELLDALKKAGLKSGSSKAKEKKGIANAKDLQQAYDTKDYKQVAEEAPKLLKKTEGKEKEQVLFLFAESLFKLGKMRDAALKYNDFLETKPSEQLVRTAKFRIGDCFRHLGDGETAKVYYEELIKEFPDSEEAVKAKERLAGNGGGAEKG